MAEFPAEFVEIIHDLDKAEKLLDQAREISQQAWGIIARIEAPYYESELARDIMEMSYKKTLFAAGMARVLAKFAEIAAMEMTKTLAYHSMVKENPSHEYTIEGKKEVVSELNSFARHHNATFKIAGEPDNEESRHILVVVTSRDKKGRYAFEDRVTKKRIGSYKSIAEILPFRFQVNDVKPNS